MKTSVKYTFILLSVFATLFFAGCKGKNARITAEEKAACRTAYDACIKECNTSEDKALNDDIACRQNCNDTYQSAIKSCNAIEDAKKRQDCLDSAWVAFNKCMDDCAASYKKALAKVTECRNACVDKLGDCLAGK